MSESQTTNPKPKGGKSMYERTIARLVELAEQRNHGLSVPEEDQVSRIKVYLARNGKVTYKETGKIPFQKCLFKHIAPLSELLEIQLDTTQLQVSKDTPIEVAQYNRMKFERFLAKVVYNGRVFVPIGATGSLKEGRLWYATTPVRNIVHEFFTYAEGQQAHIWAFFSLKAGKVNSCAILWLSTMNKD